MKKLKTSFSHALTTTSTAESYNTITMIKSLNLKPVFPIFNLKKYQNLPLVYFDSGATTLKPKTVIDATLNYYTCATANHHSHDYPLANEIENKITAARENIAHIYDCDVNHVIFTSGTTMSINQVCFGLIKLFSTADEIMISYDSHTSLSLPCYQLAKRSGANLKILPLMNNSSDIETLKKHVNRKTKLLAISSVNNLLGHCYDVMKIGNWLKNNYPNCYFLVDGAQSAAHFNVSVNQSKIDFLAISGHKMYANTGIGCLLTSNKVADLEPLMYGGNMNEDVFENGSFTFKPIPFKFEAGTSNLAGIIGINAACNFIKQISFTKIEKLEDSLKKYLVDGLKRSFQDKITIYNDDTNYHVVFNMKDVFAQDVASYLGSKNICVRSGDHCAKLINHYQKINPSIRVTFGVYNDFDDVDRFIKTLLGGGDFLGEFFD